MDTHPYFCAVGIKIGIIAVGAYIRILVTRLASNMLGQKYVLLVDPLNYKSISDIGFALYRKILSYYKSVFLVGISSVMEYIAVLGHVVYLMSKNLDGDIWKSCNKSLIMKAGVGLGT